MKFINSFKGKMIIGIIGIIICIFTVFTCYTNQYLTPQFLSEQLDMQAKFAQLCSEAILSWKENTENLSIRVATNSQIQDYLRLDAENRNNSGKIMEKNLYQIMNGEDNIQDIWLVDRSMNMVGTSSIKAVRPYIMDRISSVLRAEGDPNWDSGYDTGSMILSRAVYDVRYNPNELTGYLFLRISNSEITDFFNEYRLYDSQRFSLKGITDGFEVTEQGFFYSYYENYEKLVHVEIVFSPWYLRTWSPQSEAFSVPLAFIQKMSLTMVGILSFSSLLCILFAQRLTKPIYSMQETLQKYSEGDFSGKIEIHGNDEIAELGLVVNDMSERISDLFERVKAEENTRRKVELQTLIYQINPHFLYNTLDSVNMMAITHGDKEVSSIVTDLSRLFRLGLHQGEELITVRDEVMHVQYYLHIQEKRFSDLLSWEIDIPDELNEIKICKFILQPVVENAIVYGVKPMENGSKIIILAEENDDKIIFNVTDFGCGMTAVELENVRRRISSTKLPEDDGGFGLWNVNQRIKMYYGQEYGIKLYSEEGKGTRVELILGKTLV